MQNGLGCRGAGGAGGAGRGAGVHAGGAVPVRPGRLQQARSVRWHSPHTRTRVPYFFLTAGTESRLVIPTIPPSRWGWCVRRGVERAGVLAGCPGVPPQWPGACGPPSPRGPSVTTRVSPCLLVYGLQPRPGESTPPPSETATDSRRLPPRHQILDIHGAATVDGRPSIAGTDMLSLWGCCVGMTPRCCVRVRMSVPPPRRCHGLSTTDSRPPRGRTCSWQAATARCTCVRTVPRCCTTGPTPLWATLTGFSPTPTTPTDKVCLSI